MIALGLVHTQRPPSPRESDPRLLCSSEVPSHYPALPPAAPCRLCLLQGRGEGGGEGREDHRGVSQHLQTRRSPRLFQVALSPEAAATSWGRGSACARGACAGCTFGFIVSLCSLQIMLPLCVLNTRPP